MSLLGPIHGMLFVYIAGGAALLAIGAYIIKMRRRRFEVPFSHLWKRVLEQKDANALWKQLKRLISLLLILVILGLVLFAALDPTIGAVDRKARNVVVLFDASASMKAMDGDEGGTKSRLDAAKERTKTLIDSMGGGDVAMIMKVDGQATPMSRFSSDGPMLKKIVDAMQASDTPADLTRALGAAADALRDRTNPLIVIVSDGAFPEQQLGLVSWDATKPVQPTVDGKSNNSAQWEKKDLASVDLSKIDVRYLPVDLKKIDLAPGQRIKQIYPKLPGSTDNKLRASLRPVEGAGGSDSFALDDQAFALLPVRKKQKVLMVTTDNLFLEGALLVYDNIEQFKVTPAEYDAKPSIADGMDVVIFDEHTPSVIPPPPASLLYFHPTGPDSPIAVTKEVIHNPRITELDEGHPVMRWITMTDVYMDQTGTFAPDIKKGESTVAWSVRSSIIATKRDGRRKILAFGFSLPANGRESATDLPMRVAFPMLLVNTLDWFAGDQTDLLTTYPTGQRERIPLDGVVGATEAEVKGPDGALTKTPILDGLATFYGSRVGYYDVAAKDAKGNVIAKIELAANLASPSESDIAPSTELSLGGKKLQAPEAFAITRSRKMWTYLILFVLALIVMEWVTYHRRITV